MEMWPFGASAHDNFCEDALAGGEGGDCVGENKRMYGTDGGE
jgi:hypothetical protein